MFELSIFFDLSQCHLRNGTYHARNIIIFNLIPLRRPTFPHPTSHIRLLACSLFLLFLYFCFGCLRRPFESRKRLCKTFLFVITETTNSSVIHSQVKRSNYDSAAAEHCEKLKAEQDKCHSEITELHVKWGEIEKQRVQVVAAKANIDNMPDIVEDRRHIEQARAHLDTLESRLNDKKALRESCYNTKIIEIIHLFFVPMPQHWLNKS